MMVAKIVGEVIAIGDEIVCGKLLDTNSQWISQGLIDLGVAVRHHTTIGDRFDDYRPMLATAAHRADVIVCTGGLGPTEDDLTTAALAEFAGVALEFDDASWANIERIFARRNRPITANNRKQAMRPVGSKSIFNPEGTAPGIDMLLPEQSGRRARLFALPGVPAELRDMWPSVAAEIRLLTGQRVFYQYSLHCFGAGESEIESMIPRELMRRGRDPLVGITASQATISLRVSTIGESLDRCHEFAQPTIDTLRKALGTLVFGDESDTLESVVIEKLRQSKQTISICDLGLSGDVFQRLRSVDTASRVVRGGFQLDHSSISRVFGDALTHPPNSPASLSELAGAVRIQMDSGLGLAIGPLPAADKPRQIFHVALADSQGTHAVELSCAGHPAVRLNRSVKGVMNFLRLSH
jgi:nicotinamide-nucleotide amidase